MSTPRKSQRLLNTPSKSTPIKSKLSTPLSAVKALAKPTPGSSKKSLRFSDDVAESHAAPSTPSALPRSRSRKRLIREEEIDPVVEEVKKVVQHPAKEWAGLPSFQDIFFIGTEWAAYHDLFAIPWDFSHLAEHLSDPSILGLKHVPYIFGQSEPTFLEWEGLDADVLPVPVIILVDCAIPPPEKVGMTSIQKSEEIIKTFREVRLSWVPSYDVHNQERSSLAAASHGDVPTFFYLKCNKRKAWVDALSETRAKEFDYLNPWIWLPHKEEFDGNTVAKVLFCLENSGGAKFIEIDWEDRDDDDLYSEASLKEIMQDEDIPDTPSNREKLLGALKEAITQSKTVYREARQAFRDRQNSFTPEQKEALKNIRLIKYYPKNFPKSASKYINRYYKHAHEVYPENVSNEY